MKPVFFGCLFFGSMFLTSCSDELGFADSESTANIEQEARDSTSELVPENEDEESADSFYQHEEEGEPPVRWIRCGRSLEERSRKVKLCKVPPGNPENEHEICISISAIEAHLGTGSYPAPCD